MMRGGMTRMKAKTLWRIHQKQSHSSPYHQKDTIQDTGPPVTQGFYF